MPIMLQPLNYRCEINLGLKKSGFSMKLYCGQSAETESNVIKVSLMILQENCMCTEVGKCNDLVSNGNTYQWRIQDFP